MSSTEQADNEAPSFGPGTGDLVLCGDDEEAARGRRLQPDAEFVTVAGAASLSNAKRPGVLWVTLHVFQQLDFTQAYRDANSRMADPSGPMMKWELTKAPDPGPDELPG